MNYYKLLGVSKNATTAEIKKAYKKLAMQYHPDRATKQPDPELFNRLSTAHATLIDTVKRKQYDVMCSKVHPYAITHLPVKVISLEQAYTGGTLKSSLSTLVIPPHSINEEVLSDSNGNQYVINIKKHEKFVLRQNDLYLSININTMDAMIGVDVKVELLDKHNLLFTIDNNVTDGKKYKMTGRGFNGGDMYLCVNIVKKELSETQLKLLRTFYGRTVLY